MAASATGQQQAWDQKAIPGFYLEDVPEHLGPAREFLEKYSGIPPEDVDNHLRAIVSKPRQPPIPVHRTQARHRARGLHVPT